MATEQADIVLLISYDQISLPSRNISTSDHTVHVSTSDHTVHVSTSDHTIHVSTSDHTIHVSTSDNTVHVHYTIEVSKVR